MSSCLRGGPWFERDVGEFKSYDEDYKKWTILFTYRKYTIHKPERQWTNYDNNNANGSILRMESGDSSHNINNFRNNGCLDYV